MADPRTLELPADNITVVGAFNPAIIKPGWIARHLPDLNASLVTFVPQDFGPILFGAGDIFWMTFQDRLVVHGRYENTVPFVQKILEVLPHTPVVAAGVNLQLKRYADPHSFGASAALHGERRLVDLMQGDLVELALSHAAMRKDGVRVTLRASWQQSTDEATLDFNFQRDAAGPDEEARTRQLGEHVGRSAEFSQDAQRIAEVVSSG